jgi:hypothetical protein
MISFGKRKTGQRHNKPMRAEPATLRNICGVASHLYHKHAPLRWHGDWALAVTSRVLRDAH